MDNIQNYFTQVTISKGRIIQKEDGTTEKITDEVVFDNMLCLNSEIEIQSLTSTLNDKFIEVTESL